MANPLPLTIDFGALPNNGQGYTPQELADRLGYNARIFTEQAFALFTTGATAPTSDTGPWAANGNTWYYWDSGTGSYVPFLIPQSSLRYYVGSVAPDQTVYQFWIETTGGGSPLAVKTYFGGAWVDVYATTLGDYLTTAAFTAAIANYSTTAEMNTAIANAVAGLVVYRFSAQNAGVAQTITDNDPAMKLTATTELFDDGGGYSPVSSKFVAVETKKHFITATVIYASTSGTPTDLTFGLYIYKNGGVAKTVLFPAEGTTDARTIDISSYLDLTIGDEIEIYADISSTGAGTFSASLKEFSGFST